MVEDKIGDKAEVSHEEAVLRVTEAAIEKNSCAESIR
jgi:hypothetical protein